MVRTQENISRRNVLKGIGVGSAISMAGCIGQGEAIEDSRDVGVEIGSEIVQNEL